MKKVFAVLFIAGSLAACSSTQDGADNTADSTDTTLMMTPTDTATMDGGLDTAARDTAALDSM